MVKVKLITRKKVAATGGGSGSSGGITSGNTTLAEYAKEAQHAETADRAAYADSAGHAAQADHAATADLAELAKDLTPDSPAFDRWLRKDKSDRTPYALSVGDRLTAEGGVQFGKSFAPGLTGFGGLIDGKGAAELESLTLRRFLEVPELRYNRVTLLDSVQWATPGAGIVRTAIPDTDPDGNPTNTGTIVLHLEDGEVGTLAVDDICMGIWHDVTQTGPTSDDGRGNFVFRGFRTVYFAVTEVSADGSSLRYILRPGTTAHPVEAMHFAGYGNFTDPSRQTSRYETTTYIRFLRNVNDWEFGEHNIAAQFGDLTNLTINGKPMAGYSAYLSNIYYSGTLEAIDASRPELTVKVDGATEIGPNDTATIHAKASKYFMAVPTRNWQVTRATSDTDADAAWNAAHENLAGEELTLPIAYADLGDFARPAFTISVEAQHGDDWVTLRQTVTFARLEPIVTDRGPWAEGEEYYAGDVVGKDGRLEISDTWRYGQRWRCLVTGTATEGNGPGYGQPGWQFVGGDDALTVRFVNPPLLWDYENPYGVLQLQVIFRGEDITDRLPSTATQWERYSETADGVERVALDAAWTAANRWSGMAREIRAEDCQNKASEGVGVLKFTATVTVSDMEAVAEFTI